MDHLGRDLHRAFAGDEDDAAPVRAPHRRQIEPREAHPAEHVRLEEADPFGVGNVFERFRLEDAKIVHQNLDVGMGSEERCRRACEAQIAGEPMSVRARP